MISQGYFIPHMRDHLSIMTREEMLSMKMRLHDEMGKSLLVLRKYCTEGCPAEGKSVLISVWRDSIGLLNGDMRAKDDIDVFGELTRVAENVGISIVRCGEFPREKTVAGLFVTAIRECVINAVKHADATKVFVCVSDTEEGRQIHVTNNGSAPDSRVVEGGGLSSLRQRVERMGGVMMIRSEPRFEMTVIAPETCRCITPP